MFLFTDAAQYFRGDRERMRSLLGGKGAGLAEMSASGVRVPPGLTIVTSCCQEYYECGKKMPPGLLEEVHAQLRAVETALGRRLGDPTCPLLLSVRSGAKFSMPGMMDTILNLGLNEATTEGLARETQNPRFAWDSYRRFIQMYSSVVFEVEKHAFEALLHAEKQRVGVTQDHELGEKSLRSLAQQFKDLLKEHKKITFPEDTSIQLAGAIEAVFRSWNNSRAVYYRNLNKIDHSLGTAVTVQAMVFGNFDARSATGVCFTRDPSTGERKLYGEYLVNAQGEDVVAGVRTPKQISDLAVEMPEVHAELAATISKLEQHYKDMQDTEFTVQQGKVFLLQTRTGKRTAAAAVRVAVEMVKEGLLTRQEALLRIDPNQLNQLLLPSFDSADTAKAKSAGRLVACGLNASPGAATGEVVFSPDESEHRAKLGHKVILVRVETCPDDIRGMVPAQGIVTSRGGMTSHAAVVARGMGKPCVAGCETLKIDLAAERIQVGGVTIRKGDVISVDGSTGEIFLGALKTKAPSVDSDFSTLLGWADETRALGIRTNADTPEDAVRARQFGAQGVGLCRTEHMFMDKGRLPVMQSMIMAEDKTARLAALSQLLPMQRQDFVGIFKAMEGYPVTIRLLDPPLHEFLPKHEETLIELTTLRNKGGEEGRIAELQILLRKIEELRESNPMMGLRGCRLGLLYPEINEMQVQAIFEAAIEVQRSGMKVLPEIMIPLVGHVKELTFSREQLEAVAKRVMQERGTTIEYAFGTMIEIPRACVTADEIAGVAEFFSFGTNDLTQMTFGYSRDDAEGKFLQSYLEGVQTSQGLKKVLTSNPFEVLDQEGVGKLMRLTVELGRKRRPNLKIGICGEHGGEPSSISFAHRIGLSYVSCSPFRVPIARLAAAQASLHAAASHAGTERDR
jgi:pyruvate,orthophosphate dikinase